MSKQPPVLFATETACAGAVCATGAARADLAQALGLAEAGQRATAVLTGDDLARVVDLLGEAAARMLPLVVRVRIAGGHAGLHAIADTGVAVLFAAAGREVAALHVAARLLAERALMPVVLADEADGTAPEPLPAAAVELLGRAADFVPAATPAQALLFGDRRRRVVRWFDLERPVLRGQAADAELAGLQRAGRGPFAAAPVAELLPQAFADAGTAAQLPLAEVAAHALEGAEIVVVALGGGAAPAPDAGRPRIGVLGLRALRPFPLELAESLRGRTAVVLERTDVPLAGDPPLLREVRACLGAAEDHARAARHPWKDKERPHVAAALHGLAGAPLPVADLRAFCREAKVGGRGLVHLGIDFAGRSRLPKRVVLHENLRRAQPGLAQLGLRTAAPAASGAAAPPPPARAAAPAKPAATHDDLVRFWELLGAPEVASARAELGPDPYLTAGSVPARSVACRTAAPPAELPVFDASACTACGRCWTACPDGAVLPAALTPAELFEAAMQRAADGGAVVAPLRQIAARVHKAVGAVPAGDAGVTLRAAFASVLDKLGDERAAPLREPAAAVALALAGLPIARTEPLFARAEAQAPGSGALLALPIDPELCKGCNLCVAECAPGALQAAACTQERAAAARTAAALWRALPDTSGAVIAAARQLPEPGLLGALQLSRHCLHTLVPGDPSAPGLGSKVALRSVLACAEAHLQPLLQQHLQEIDQLAAEFAARIRDLLGSALPANDLDALHEGLHTIATGPVALSTLAGRLDQLAAGGRVDAPRLQRLVDVARDLADLRFRIATAHSGLGRARLGLVLQDGDATAWAHSYPWNPFAAPAVVDGGDAGACARGLLRGAAAALAADFALLRSARALLQKVPMAAPPTSLADLTAAERQLCPPLFVVADAKTLAQRGLDQLAVLLDGDLPVKVLALGERDPAAALPDLAVLALAFRSAFVLQGSIAARDHLAAGMLAALRHPGPAFVHVHAPQPIGDGLPPERVLGHAAGAIAARVQPLFCSDPSLPGAFGLRLSLAGNPDLASDAPADAATWAAAVPAWRRHFAPTAPGDAGPTPLAEYLRLEPRQRQGRTAVVSVDGAPQKLSPALLAAALRADEQWRTLLELAGLRTPFVARVEANAKAAVEQAHAHELAALRREHERQLQGLRAAVEQELAARLQRRLLQLASGVRP